MKTCETHLVFCLQYVTGIQDAMGFVAVFFGSLEVLNAGTYTFCLDSHDGYVSRSIFGIMVNQFPIPFKELSFATLFQASGRFGFLFEGWADPSCMWTTSWSWTTMAATA
jgi:hypothetical protein